MSLSRYLVLYLSVVLVAALVTFGFRAIGTGSAAPDAATQRAATPSSSGHAQELAALRSEVERLRHELDSLRASAWRGSHEPAPSARVADLGPRPSEPPPVDDGAELTPREALALYVASFQGGGTGIEYYRLIVQAHLPVLVLDVLGLVVDRSGTPLLRLRLTELLNDTRLTGHDRVLNTLFTVATGEADRDLVLAAARAVSTLATLEDARILERRWWEIEYDEGKNLVLDRIFELAGADPNPKVDELLGRAPNDEAQRLLLARLHAGYPDSAAPSFQRVRMLSQPVRLDGAGRIHQFRSPTMRALLEDWRATEPDEEVRAALGRATELLAQIPNHHPEQATGPPNVPNATDDNVGAWATSSANSGAEWLEVTYDPPMVASEVRIHQTCVPGAIVRVELILANGSREVAWTGPHSGDEAGVFAVPIAPPKNVAGVHIALDTTLRSGYNEIDAVELVGPGGQAWASGATASSWYGSGQNYGGGGSIPTIDLNFSGWGFLGR